MPCPSANPVATLQWLSWQEIPRCKQWPRRDLNHNCYGMIATISTHDPGISYYDNLSHTGIRSQVVACLSSGRLSILSPVLDLKNFSSFTSGLSCHAWHFWSGLYFLLDPSIYRAAYQKITVIHSGVGIRFLWHTIRNRGSLEDPRHQVFRQSEIYTLGVKLIG